MEQQNFSKLNIDSNASYQLKEIAKWSKFLSIVGFIMCGFVALAGVFTGSMFASISTFTFNLGGSSFPATSATMIVFYVVYALILFIPSLYLYQASDKLRNAVAANDSTQLTQGFVKLKACFRYWSILTIVAVCLFALISLITYFQLKHQL